VDLADEIQDDAHVLMAEENHIDYDPDDVTIAGEHELRGNSFKQCIHLCHNFIA